jgi:hypothetical protein
MSVDNGDILRGVVEMNYGGGEVAQNVYHWKANLTASWNNAAALGAMTTHIETMYGQLVNQIADTVTMGTLNVYKVVWDSVEGQWVVDEWIGEAVPDVTFLATDDALPNQNAATISANTMRPKSRGRKFIPGLTDLSAVGSDIISGVLPHLVDFATDWLSDIVLGFDGELVSGIVRTAFEEFLPFTLATVNSVMGSMRTRKPGVGA